MKRPPPTFVVEVRRLRRSTNSDGKTWLAEPPLADAASGSQRLSGAAAPFEAEPKAPPAVETPPSRPQGRILPSLVDIEPIAPPFEEAAAPPRRRRERSAATPKPKTRTKKDADREIAPPFWSASTEIEEAGGTAPEPGRKAKIASPGAKPKQEAATAEALAGLLAAHAVADANPAVPAAALESATADRAGARQARHRRILDRYVLGAEIKPGERWKRRLQKARKQLPPRH
jgi:hypothetical protein